MLHRQPTGSKQIIGHNGFICVMARGPLCVCGGDGEAELLVLTSVSVLGLVLLVALDLRGYLVVVRAAVRTAIRVVARAVVSAVVRVVVRAAVAAAAATATVAAA